MNNSARVTVPQRDVESLVNSSGLEESIDRPAEPVIGQLRLTVLLRRTVERCGIQQKLAARTQGYDEGFWSATESGKKKAQLDPIAELPIDVQQAFVAAWAERLGMTCYLDDPKLAALDALVTAAQRCQRILQAELHTPSKAHQAKAALR